MNYLWWYSCQHNTKDEHKGYFNSVEYGSNQNIAGEKQILGAISNIHTEHFK